MGIILFALFWIDTLISSEKPIADSVPFVVVAGCTTVMAVAVAAIGGGGV
jgi:hypothetical protein